MKNILKRAKISNSLLCRETDNYGYYTNFSRERNREGWDILDGATMCGVSSGFLFLSADGPAPSITRTNPFIPVDSSTNTEIVLRFKYQRNNHRITATQGKIQFTTLGNSVFDDTKSVLFDLILDDKWHTYFINMAPLQEWVGSINNLKIFFAIDGRAGDEVFIDSIRIQKPDFNFCSHDCFNDIEELIIGESFENETLFSLPSDFSPVNVDQNRIVSINRDPTLLSNNVLSLNKASGSSIGPGVVRQFSSIVSGYFSCKFKSSVNTGSFKLQTDVSLNYNAIELVVNTSNGRLRYKNGPSYLDLDVLKTINIDEWNYLFVTFNSQRSTFSVYLNSELIGQNLSYNYAGLIESVRLENSSTVPNNFLIDDILLISSTDTNINCDGMGKQGYITGLPILFSNLSIIKDVNDRLIVNINNYGDVVVTLPEVTNADPVELRNLLEDEITKLDLGGYTYCEVIFSDNCYSIKSGTFGFDSNVTVRKYQNSQLAEQLGFCNDSGEVIGNSYFGRPHVGDFQFTNSCRIQTRFLNKIKKDENIDPIVINPKLVDTEIGLKYAGRASRGRTYSGRNKTIIDYNYRATNEGKIKEIYFHGELPLAASVKITGSTGYFSNNEFYPNLPLDLDSYNIIVGDLLVIDDPQYLQPGTYVIDSVDLVNNRLIFDRDLQFVAGSSISFYIHNIAKVKQFRPNIDGQLTLINEAYIGNKEDDRLYTNTPDTFKIAVDWYLHRGDFIAIYNAKNIYIGNDLLSKPDCSFIEISGDITAADITNVSPLGQGLNGIGLYGTSNSYQTLASFDIELEDDEVVDILEIFGHQLSERREYNLTTCLNYGLSVSVNVSGTHTHLLIDQDGFGVDVVHPNIAYNISSLTDGKLFASNGYLGYFEQNDNNATYFYLDGDAEFFVPKTQDGVTIPSLETAGMQSNWDRIKVYDYYQSVPFSVILSWQQPKTIHKYKIYYKEYPNLDGFYLEWLKYDTSGGNSLGYFEKIGLGQTAEFSRVILDNSIIDWTDITDTEELYRHFQPTYDGYISLSKILNEDSALGAPFRAQNPYTVMEKIFTNISTTAFRLYCLHHKSTKISEIELYSSTTVETTLQDCIDVYASSDGDRFYKLNIDLVQDNSLRFKIGVPIKYLRIRCNPTATLLLKTVFLRGNDDYIRYTNDQTNIPTRVIDIPPLRGSFSNTIRTSVINKTGETANVEIDLETVELYEDVSIKSSLNSLTDVLHPEVGPSPILVLDSDYPLRTSQNVAINSNCYGLKNLAENKKYYISEYNNSESDMFYTHVDSFKWESFYTNFPQTTPYKFWLEFPGFSIAPYHSTTGYPGTTTPITAELRSRWKTSTSFSAKINAIYDARSSRSNPMRTTLGIIDDSGRKIYIRKERTYYGQGSPTNVYNNVTYKVGDSLVGIMDTDITVEQYYSPQFGEVDDYVEYSLVVERVKTLTSDKLYLSYIDIVNGNNKQQWKENPYFEVDLNNLGTPLVGQLRIYLVNYWNAAAGSSQGGIGPEGPFIRVNSFYFSGESTMENKYYSFSPPYTVGISGYINLDNRCVTYPALKYVALDLGKKYSLDIYQVYTKTGKPLWNINNATYSNSETDNPAQVSWGNSSMSDVRWILFAEQSVPTASSGNKYLDYIRLYPDITSYPVGYIYNSEWDDLGNLLTDGKTTSYATQIQYPILAVRLDTKFDIETFKILDNKGYEIFDRLDYYEGWLPCFYSLSTSLTDDPHCVIWDNWKEYGTNLVKEVKKAKWLSFKNTDFNLYTGNTPVKKISAVEVSTRGLDNSSIGQIYDLVDFTEYANWFEVSYISNNNLAYVEPSLNNLHNILYGCSKQIRRSNESSYNCFDENDNTVINLYGASSNIWRLFGDVIQTTTTGANTVVSGNDSQFVISGNVEESFAVNLQPTEIIGVGVYLPVNPPALPNTITIQRLNGTDPLNNSHWYDYFTQTDLVSWEYVDSSNQEAIFNNGKLFEINFEDSITISGIRVKFSDIIPLNSAISNTLTVSEVRIFSMVDEDNNYNILTIDNDDTVRISGSKSLKLTYKSGYNNAVNITCPKSFNILSDSKISLQDYFSFYCTISDLSVLDYDNSFIRIGNNSTYYYEWSFSLLESSITNELNLQKLKILDAIQYPIYTGDEFPKQVDLTKEINYLQIKLVPKVRTTEDFSIWFDNFSIIREKFNIQGINKTLYLNNSELIYYPLVDFNIQRGFFEATITPDWNNRGSRRNNEEGGDELYSIFTALNEFSETFSIYYSNRTGLSIAATTISERYQFPIGYILDIKRYKPFKLSVLWDCYGLGIDCKENVTIRVYVNDRHISDVSYQWEPQYSKTCMLFIGSKAFLPDLSDIGYNPILVNGSAYSVYPDAYSITGGIENLIISTLPKKIEYSNIQRLKNKIYLSIDGVNFYSGDSDTLPFIINGVVNFGEIDIWLKTNFPKDIKNLSRIAFLKTKWRLTY